ncbi:MAG: hypothetical protein IJ159_02400 [Prevotella sp.]|nr:hypothetical protein [Prevotella sp.]
MKKSIICLIAAAAMVASCDPIKEEKDFDVYTVSSGEIETAISFTQTDADGNVAADGNYFTYTTNPAMQVTIFNYLSDGSENMLARGMSGSFTIKPKRGSDPNQTFYVRVVGSDNQPVEISKTYNVFVQQELDPEIRLLASDAYGSKTWKWDASATDGVVWGNMGYCGGSGADVALASNGKWWGVTSEEEFLTQLGHTHDGAYHGDGDVANSKMVFTDEGIATTYDANGDVIRTAPFTVEGYNADAEWRKGLLKTTAILWPYEINSGGNVPGEYEIVYLTADKLCLVYPDGGAYDGLGNWGEATFWHFTSGSDIEGMAIGYGKTASKDWTWDYDGTSTVWGNMGYCGGAGSDVGTAHNGQWWGVTNEAEFMGQLNHTNDGAAHGDESMDAYFTLSNEGTIVRHAGDGSVINNGTFEFDTTVANDWKVANLKTTAGTILFPYEINSGGNMPTTFEVVYQTNDKMCLVYPDGGAFDGLGNWGEATYWHFKAK